MPKRASSAAMRRSQVIAMETPPPMQKAVDHRHQRLAEAGQRVRARARDAAGTSSSSDCVSAAGP